MSAQGPNVRRLIAHKMSVDAVPKGGGLADAITFLTSPGAIGRAAKEATAWVAEAIRVVRLAVEPNPWKQADDETIAGEILRHIEERKRKARHEQHAHLRHPSGQQGSVPGNPQGPG